MKQEKTLYASVDLELTGFDPLVDEVVEIGIVLFEIQSGKMVVLKEWDSLIKPKATLHARIQGLTGITEFDLQSAPSKEQVLPEVQALLRGTMLVGHGVGLDKRFLEGFGVEVKVGVLDTLELAQIFLPTYHSYNLENLSHALAIHHGSAHRALSDAQATVGVLRALVAIFWSLAEGTRTRVAKIAQQRGYAWAIFFTDTYAEQLDGVVFTQLEEVGHIGISEETLPIFETASSVFSVHNAFEVPWKALADDREAWVVALSSREQVLEVAKKGYATPFLGIAEAVSSQAIEQAESSVGALHEREVLALLKILVWQANQTTATPLLAEINWSLLGVDFKKRFSEVRPFPQAAGVVVVDYRSIAGIPPGKSIWICETDKYIQWVEQQSGHMLSWQGIIHQLRQIYNPETGFGDVSKAIELQEAVVATDLFYASVLLLLKKHHGVAQGIVAQADVSPFVENQLIQAGNNYAQRLGRLSALASDKNFTRIVQNVETFFQRETPIDELRWIEIGDGRCVFISRPLNLALTQQNILRGARKIVYTTDVRSGQCLRYIAERVSMGTTPPVLMASISTPLVVNPTVAVYTSEAERGAALLQSMTGELAYYVFPDQRTLKAYYDAYYARFSQKQAIIAVGVHGGVNKVLRNFAFSTKSIVLIAHAALAGFNALKLDAKRVVYVGLPNTDMSHPFTVALAQKFFNSVDEANLTFQALGFVQSLRPFGKTAQKFEVSMALLEAEAQVCERLLSVEQDKLI